MVEWWKHLRWRKRDQEKLVRTDGKKQIEEGIENNYWEDVHYQYRVGLYDETEFARQRLAWEASFSRSKFQKIYWCEVRLGYSPEFAAEVDGLPSVGAC